jgi:hypothetical protein
MLTRRDLLLGFAITVLPTSIRATQGEKPPGRDGESRTVTLIIEGMT